MGTEGEVVAEFEQPLASGEAGQRDQDRGEQSLQLLTPAT